MFTVNQNIEHETIIKNSRFICLLFRINSIDEINTYLKETKEKYTKATHYCYAYILDDFKKTSDDGEPGGTAGMPILNILEKNNITNTLAIVVRYFGGIKLGAGGLVRAYSKSVRDTLDIVELNKLVEGYLVELNINYNELDNLIYLLNNPIITNKDFKDSIVLTLKLNNDQINVLNNKNYNYKILEKILIENKK